MSREKIFESTHYVLTRDENEEKIELASKFYCLTGYGNNITTYITLDKVKHTVDVRNVRVNCNGTGSDLIAYLELNVDEFNKLLETARSIKTQEDFDKMIEVIKDIESRIEEEYSKRVDELIDEFVSVSTVQEKLRSLKNEEVLRELREYLREKVDDFLDP
jgi:Xaa-Pro aminopeptidase